MSNIAHIFREYDIRGIAGSELSTDRVADLGLAFATHVRQEAGGQPADPLVICTGRDGRNSSPTLAAALADGLARGGAEVIECGLVPTPALYFANYHFAAAGAIMLTGSHNPPEYNGLKMVRHNQSVYGAEIQALRRRLEAGVTPAGQPGTIRQEPILARYLARILADFKPGRAIRVVLDCGNGATGVVAPELLARLPGVTGEVLFAEVDGNFPNHHPDPTVPKNLLHLQRRMQETGAELGIAFDGDGDRIGALDEAGRVVWGDRLMILFARDILPQRPGATIIGDVKCSQLLFDAVAQAGGTPLMWKTGHSLVKTKMRETGAPLAGEMSGHLFFADRYLGYDDALYAAVRLIELVASGPEPLSQRLHGLPDCFATPELRLECPDDRKFQVMERVVREQERLGGDFSAVDGVRVRTAQGWWLLRVSNTQPALVARVEANSRVHLQQLVEALATVLAKEGIAMPDWQEA
ncbi:MAG: phosphomannomutase/phosphoglucomutase [Magnetococcales bacterium]|nr:phosphomannomutase/phosphoglucomutase [Magnetococcales bacterium]